MQMTLDEFTARFPDRRRPVQAEYAGQWVAWNDDGAEVLAHGESLSGVRETAVQRGCARPVLQKVPHGPFVDGA
jgi:hypothetical protein